MIATLIKRLQRLQQRVIRDRDHIIYECRRCGTTVDHTTNRCPTCNATGIAQYHL